jgi:glyoxylase-like metal-dependent hydrolase (beta-lactamase superfamily II)
VLFTGDTIAIYEGAPMVGPFNLDREMARDFVRRQGALQFESACFGHGPPLVGGANRRIAELAGRL